MRKNLLAVALAILNAAPCVALPTLSLVDFGGGAGGLMITVTEPGSIAAEITLEYGGDLSISDITINSDVFDTANPGDSPFIPGSQVGGDSVGLTFEPESNRAFASFGSSVIESPGSYHFLTFGFNATSACGSYYVSAAGLVAQGGNLTTGLATYAAVHGDILADYDGDCDVDGDDFGVFVNEFNLGTVPPAAGLGDFDGDDDIDGDDFGVFVSAYNISNPASSGTIPEPGSLWLAFVGVAALKSSRRRCTSLSRTR